jgi:CRISPR-associated endonuclease Csy4
MDHYVDLRIRPDPEFPVSQLMSILFTLLHLA